jgi:hypothetical protein
MKLPDENAGDTGKVRRQRARGSPNGWTAHCLATLRKLLHEHPPASLCHFKGPKRRRQVLVHETEGFHPAKQYERRKPSPLDRGPQCRATFEKLARAVRDYGEEANLRGFWCLYIEDGRWAGFHFHLWCEEPLPAEMVAALQKTWLRLMGEPDNKRQCFRYDAVIRHLEKSISYCGKEFDGEEGWIVKEAFNRWGASGQFRPYRTGNARRASHFPAKNSHLRAPGGEKNTVSFQVPEPAPVLIPVRERELLLSAKSTGEPEHDYTTGGPRRQCAVSRQTVRIAVRVSPLYGPGDVPIRPAAEWAVAHFQRLRVRWTIEPDSIRHPGPGFPPESVEAVFLIAAGHTREFEHQAAGGFARLFRP